MPMPKKVRKPCRYCDTETKRLKNVFCDSLCQHAFQYQQYIVRWQAGLESGCRGEAVSQHIRRYLYEKHGQKCQECGWNKKHPVTGRIPLTVEHKDGNWQNNVEENLQLLCPNCHALTLTYGTLNRGRGRPGRQALRVKKRSQSNA